MPETTNTPTGEYPRPAAAHLLDLDSAADQLVRDLAGKRRQTKTLARESGVSVLLMAMDAGDAVREHSADGVVTIHTLRGNTVLTVGADEFTLSAGNLIMLQPGVRHDIRAEKQSVVLLTITGGE